jgi:hypothetical protein
LIDGGSLEQNRDHRVFLARKLVVPRTRVGGPIFTSTLLREDPIMRLGRFRLWFWTCSLLAVAVVGLGIAAQSGASSNLVVHEWGTFLAMSGSDGVSLEGMYHEEHALPPFVHARSRDQLRLPSVLLKGETPVIYFYTGCAQKVRVDVRFPRGLWTQWYPQAQVVGPQLSETTTPPDLRGGRIMWCAELIPGSESDIKPVPPETAKDALWNFARDVDAAFVRTTDGTRAAAPLEAERFLFYRGLGRAPLPLRLTAALGGTLALDSNERLDVRHIFIVRVEGGRGVYTYRPVLRPGERVTGAIPGMDGARPLPEFSQRLGDDLAARLVASGLFAKEARAMVNTWRSSYFQTEGIRVLFVLPRESTDALIPMTITPAPTEFVRVMVGRLEVLTPERERAAERAVLDLAAPDPASRGRAYEFLLGQGRYVEPVLRRVLSTTGDETVRTLCRRLLLAGFVTDLRAAAHATPASDGARLRDDPMYVRAQLACLLKEIGLEAEARSEGAAVTAVLRERAEPPRDHAESRSYLRAWARAMEASGDDREAARWYGRFIEFGSQVRSDRNCLGCHQDAGPRDLAWFRDWWAGQRYGRSTLRAGHGDESVARHEALLVKNPGDAATRMMLAYLYEASGETAKAQAQWAALGVSADGVRAATAAGSFRPARPAD